MKTFTLKTLKSIVVNKLDSVVVNYCQNNIHANYSHVLFGFRSLTTAVSLNLNPTMLIASESLFTSEMTIDQKRYGT